MKCKLCGKEMSYDPEFKNYQCYCAKDEIVVDCDRDGEWTLCVGGKEFESVIDKLKEKEPCEYCKSGPDKKPIWDTENKGLFPTDKREGVLLYLIENRDILECEWDSTTYYGRINYCPMCSRKLPKKDEEQLTKQIKDWMGD